MLDNPGALARLRRDRWTGSSWSSSWSSSSVSPEGGRHRCRLRRRDGDCAGVRAVVPGRLGSGRQGLRQPQRLPVPADAAHDRHVGALWAERAGRRPHQASAWRDPRQLGPGAYAACPGSQPTRTHQTPVLGRHTTRSARPSPPKLPGCGSSPATPHWTVDPPLTYQYPLLGRKTARSARPITV